MAERGSLNPPLELIEIAPGIEIDRHILPQMDFVPAISPTLATMDAALFGDAAMDLRERMLSVPLAQRFDYDADSNVLFIDFEGLSVDGVYDIAEIEAEVERRVGSPKRRVQVVVSYDHFSIRPEFLKAKLDE